MKYAFVENGIVREIVPDHPDGDIPVSKRYPPDIASMMVPDAIAKARQRHEGPQPALSGNPVEGEMGGAPGTGGFDRILDQQEKDRAPQSLHPGTNDGPMGGGNAPRFGYGGPGPAQAPAPPPEGGRTPPGRGRHPCVGVGPRFSGGGKRKTNKGLCGRARERLTLICQSDYHFGNAPPGRYRRASRQ